MTARILAAAVFFGIAFLMAFYIMGEGGGAPQRIVTEETASAAVETDAGKSYEGPALWEVRGHGGRAFLFGSFHLLKSDHHWQSYDILETFAKAGILVVEINPRKHDPDDMRRAMISEARLPLGTTLKDVLSPETHQLVQRRARELRLDPAFLEGFRPWFVALTLTQRILTDEGYDSRLGVDEYFVQRAEYSNRPIVELETLADQIAALAGAPETDQEEQLRAQLEKIDDTRALFDKLGNAWLEGDVAALAKFMGEERARDPAGFDAVYAARNKRWVQKIEEFLAGGKTHFIVVGVGHLVGENSVVALLRKRGLQVQRWHGDDARATAAAQ